MEKQANKQAKQNSNKTTAITKHQIYIYIYQKQEAGWVIASKGEPSTVIFLNGHGIKLLPNAYLYAHRLVHLSALIKEAIFL